MMSIKENTKTCTSCHKDLSLSEFYADKSKSSGYKSACKSCVRKKKNERAKKQKEVRIKKKVPVSKFSTNIECKTCHEEKSSSEFYKRNNKIIQTCMDCRRKNRKEEYQPKKSSNEIEEENLEACLEAIVQITTGLKKCRSCQIWKEYPQFKKRERSLSGRSSVCKLCADISNNGNDMTESFIKARKALDERNQKIIRLTLKHKGTIK